MGVPPGKLGGPLRDGPSSARLLVYMHAQSALLIA